MGTEERSPPTPVREFPYTFYKETHCCSQDIEKCLKTLTGVSVCLTKCEKQMTMLKVNVI